MFRIIVFLLLAFFSCKGSSQQKKTPKEFINEVIVDKTIYSRDSTAMVANLYQKMKKHEASFANPEYYDSTILIIDTIIYDHSLDRIAVFVIAKNSTYRNPLSDSKLPFYYNANCYLGKRMRVDSTVFELKQLGPFSLGNFHLIEEIRQAIRHYYFLELATVLDEKSHPVFNYNIDDKRFWNSPTGWKRMFE